VANLLDLTISHLEQLVIATEQKVYLTHCYFEDEFCCCRQLATVHSLADEREYCARHFREVNRD
jgi:hypothetical protein